MHHANRVVLFGALAAIRLLVHTRGATAQITAATISGTVKDETGRITRTVTSSRQMQLVGVKVIF